MLSLFERSVSHAYVIFPVVSSFVVTLDNVSGEAVIVQ